MKEKTSPILAVIIVSYNTVDLTVQTVRSVLAEVERAASLKHRTEVWVVDNNSTDGTVAELKEEFGNQIQTIANTSNLGFAAANNQVITRTSTPFVLLLNSDTVVLPGGISELIKAFNVHTDDETTAYTQRSHGLLDHLGIVAATLLNPDGSLQPQGGSLPTLLSLASHMCMLDDVPLLGRLLPSTQHTGLRHVDYLRNSLHDSRVIQKQWVGGTAMMVRRETLEEIGLLDENIFMYGEDVEFCLRAKNHHWDVGIAPQAHITHFGSASSSSARAIHGELDGLKYLWAKHKPNWQQPIASALITFGALLRAVVFATIGADPARSRIYWQYVQKHS